MSDLQHNTGKPDASFWKKKAAAGFLMSVLIFFIHLSTFYNYSDTGNLMSAVNSLLAITFKEGFTRFVVPLYFIIAGALFFRDYSKKKYVPKLRKRVKTLLIPYLMWNVIWMIFCIVDLLYLPFPVLCRQREIRGHPFERAVIPCPS